MSFDPRSTAIVHLAWERRLGLADGALAAAGGTRLVHAVDGARSVTFLRLWGQPVLAGPAEVLAAAADVADDDLADHATLLALTRGLGGTGLGTASLYVADDLPLLQPAAEITVSHGNPEAVLLESRCPPDDANEVHLAQLEHKFTVMVEDEPVACGAYTEWQGFLGSLGVLVAPDYRRQGLGLLAASIAAHEALASGLVLQWRSDISNIAANSLARALSLSWAGTQTSVRLG
ncbi:GNAT family N-acetyltransferase [Arthrobacter sp. 35W]|uniref:GNAT family N-acetyltransferase n=1 Tax=Arthrobacter sp. 35W TaxID=1132441 RepID=UPI00040B9566|nr:GNAT family N-acetyltransferase [Arthrobacter sp. 35W]